MGIWHGYVDFIEWCLHSIIDYTHSAGLAIIIFTIILKTLMLPLTVKSIRSTANMQELQPKIRELQKKYGQKDRQKLNQEMMRLYQEYQINPAAGCLPMLIQIPIFFGLYFAVREISRDGASFLWLDSLSSPDPYKILPIVAGVFQFVQTKMMRPANQGKITDPQQAMMNTMMNFMPLLVIIFGWSFDSGAVLYWATQSVYSVIQQWFITGWGQMKNWVPWLPELPENKRLGGRKKELVRRDLPEDHKPGGMMGRMQKWASDAEDRQQERRGQLPNAASKSNGSGSASRSAGGSGSGGGSKSARGSKARVAAHNRAAAEASADIEGEDLTGPDIVADDVGAKTRTVTGRARRGRTGASD